MMPSTFTCNGLSMCISPFPCHKNREHGLHSFPSISACTSRRSPGASRGGALKPHSERPKIRRSLRTAVITRPAHQTQSYVARRHGAGASRQWIGNENAESIRFTYGDESSARWIGNPLMRLCGQFRYSRPLCSGQAAHQAPNSCARPLLRAEKSSPSRCCRRS